MTETHLVLKGFLLVADRQVRSVDIQVDVVVTSDAPATLPSSGHPLELHLDVTALLPLLARRGQAEDTAIHIHCPQQGCWHDCTSNLEGICVKAQKFVYTMLSLSVYLFHSVSSQKHYISALLKKSDCVYCTSAFEKESPKCQEAPINPSCDVCELLLNLLCKIHTNIINISVYRIEVRLKSKTINCSECNCFWRQPVSSKVISAKRRIQGHHHNAHIYHHYNNKTYAVFYSIKGI